MFTIFYFVPERAHPLLPVRGPRHPGHRHHRRKVGPLSRRRSEQRRFLESCFIKKN